MIGFIVGVLVGLVAGYIFGAKHGMERHLRTILTRALGSEDFEETVIKGLKDAVK